MVLSYAATVGCILVTIVACALARVLIQVLQLGIGGAAFLAQNHARHGDTFSIGALPPRLVFLFDPAAVRQFFTAPVDEVDFCAAVEHFTQRVFQVTPCCNMRPIPEHADASCAYLTTHCSCSCATIVRWTAGMVQM